MLSSTRAHENRGAHGTVRAMRVPAQGGARERHQATPARTARSRERYILYASEQCVGFCCYTKTESETN
eukprot:scaffold23462_cov66-Phaeocystis_antarctica.AAC.7